jgi:hypothetical protein
MRLIKVGRSRNKTMALAMREAGILLLDCRDANHGTSVAITTVNRHDGAQESECIDPVCLHPTCPSIDLQTSGIKHMALDANLDQRSRQPETVISGLLAHKNMCTALKCGTQPINQLGNLLPVMWDIRFAWVTFVLWLMGTAIARRSTRAPPEHLFCPGGPEDEHSRTRGSSSIAIIADFRSGDLSAFSTGQRQRPLGDPLA